MMPVLYIGHGSPMNAFADFDNAIFFAIILKFVLSIFFKIIELVFVMGLFLNTDFSIFISTNLFRVTQTCTGASFSHHFISEQQHIHMYKRLVMAEGVFS